jgi:hypothetical protein
MFSTTQNGFGPAEHALVFIWAIISIMTFTLLNLAGQWLDYEFVNLCSIFVVVIIAFILTYFVFFKNQRHQELIGKPLGKKRVIWSIILAISSVISSLVIFLIT